MNRKKIIKQLNSQKGFSSGDTILALLMILTAVGVITMIYTNLVIGSRGVDRKTGATRIATNILENMSQLYYDEINAVSSTTGGKIFNTSIPNGYTTEVKVEKVGQYDFVKKATVTVKYKVDGIEKKVELVKVFERETIRECNSPNFTEEYIRQMLPTGNYILYDGNAHGAGGQKVICPIQYDKSSNRYQIVTQTDSLWYSYSNKQWARVLIVNSESLANLDIKTELKGSNSYVWIPRFGVQDGGNPFGDTYFKYKATDYAILNSYHQNPRPAFFYHYMDHIGNWSSGREMAEQGLLGKWYPYSEIANTASLAYLLNQSQYGPMLEY